MMRNANDVFVDFAGRRRGILRALTTEVEAFWAAADPARENLVLYSNPDGSWEVSLPTEEVPPEIPEPALGINFARDGMKRQDWLSLVAVHSDTWLISVAFYNGARLDKEGREELFQYINSLPTCFEVVSGKVSANPRGEEVKRPLQGAAGGGLAKKPKQGGRPGKNKHDEDDYDEDNGEEDEDAEGGYGDGEGDPCPNCGKLYRNGEFWIQCDFCDRWFDGKCVQMTEQRAQLQKHWKCPFCRPRADGPSN